MYNVVAEGTSLLNVTKDMLFIADPQLLSDGPVDVIADSKGEMVLGPTYSPVGFLIYRVTYGSDDFPSKLFSYRPSPSSTATNTTRPDYWVGRADGWFKCTEPLDATPQCIAADSKASRQSASRILDALCEADLPWSPSGSRLAGEASLRMLLGPDSKRCKRRPPTPIELMGSGTRFVDTFATP